MKKNKITIGIFNDSFFPMTDGVVLVIDNYAKRLAKFANVIVFVPSYINKEYDDSSLPYKVVRCHSLPVFFLDYSLPIPKLDLQFQKILKKYKLDIVHIHSPFTLGLAGIHYAKKNHVPCIATMHSQFKQDFEKATHFEITANTLTKEIIKVFEKCDVCYAVNSEIARIYHEEYGYSIVPKVMNNATDLLPADENKANKYINELYNINSDEKVFLFVGRINTLKNILFIVESLAHLTQINKDLKFKMLFVGTGQDEDKLKEHIKKYHLEDKVILCGKVMDRVILSYYYKRANLFLFPSIYDASSLVQIEAASQKTPTVFLKNTATAATVTDNVNGFLADNDPYLYAKKINDILSDEKFYKEVCENAYKDLYKTWDEIIKEVYKDYIKLIDDYK